MTSEDINMMKLHIFSSCYSALVTSDRYKDEWTTPKALADDALEYAKAGWESFARSIAKPDSQD